MTGRRIQAMRTRMKLDPFAFAAVIGVHISTIYRWESSRGDVSMDPLQDKLCDAMAKLDDRKAAKVGREIVDALIRGGTLHGLYALLQQIVKTGR